jgi:type I restriction enzyme M protein
MKNINQSLEKCQDTIRNVDGITSSDAFDEMSKILFCLMNDNKISSVKDIRASYKGMFEKYPDIFNNDEINLKDVTISTIYDELFEYDLFNETEDVKGITFEKFLGRTFTGELGQFFTPKKIISFISNMVLEIINKNNLKINNVYDPTCGSGGFLVESHKLFKDSVTYYGSDINPRILSVCKRNLLAHNISNTSVINSDFIDVEYENFFDVILTNPPFGVKEKRRDRLDKFSLSRNKKDEVLEVIFIEKIIKSLNIGGIAAIVLPDGILNNVTDLNVRNYIIKHCNIIASIDLPQNTFKSAGTGCETSILFIQKKDSNNITNKTFLYKPNEVGFERKSKLAKEIIENDLIDCLEQFKNENEDFFYTINSNRFDAKYFLNKTTGDYLSTICEKSGGRVKNYDGFKKYIEFSNIDDFGFIIGCDEYEFNDLPSRGKIIVKSGDIICAKLKDSSDKIAIITDEYNDCVVSSGFFVIKPKLLTPEFLLCILKLDTIQKQIKNKTTGSIMPSISDDEFMSLNIPHIENIEDLNNKFSSLYNELFNVKDRIKNDIAGFNDMITKKGT